MGPVGNNLKVLVICGAMKYSDLVHALKPDPVTNVQDPRRIFAFICQTPEATYMVTFLLQGRTMSYSDTQRYRVGAN